ncbi:helix-turn-helix domain-containing protein [Enterococcus sp.]|uniref:helix-turn-helix domain-containing protein n=1 Tax=Enterococcus sp. TaxID=35783 RepID=UPI0029081912|nr:helix-turn-helix domain-containing protein [Enterococcus sp.]MDU5335530.1 helix-turn-helix domain-containing protein [Enterococcus sp.]
MVEIGAKIKELREAKKMSQKDLAAFLNVTPQAVSKWERNKSYPDLDMLVKLSQYFQVSADELLGNSKPSFFASFFSKTKKEDELEKSIEIKQYPKGEVPKAVSIDNMSGFLRITFDNEEIRYLRSHLFDEMLDLYVPKKGRIKRNLFAFGRHTSYHWIGSEFEFKESGEVILNGTDSYSPEELWYDSKAHINELPFP